MEATTLPNLNQPRGPALNALKHGRYAETILLPSEDPAEFRRRRRAAFHGYRPQTEDEAYLVEAMVEHRWRMERWRHVEALFDAQAIDLDMDLAERIAEPIAHQRLHSSIDVTLHRARMERLWYRALSRLLLLQDQRRKGLIPGALKLPLDCYMETDGRVVGPVLPRVIVPIPEADLDAEDASDSSSGAIGNSTEQQQPDRAEVEESLHPMESSAGGRVSTPETWGNNVPQQFVWTNTGGR